jgi:hypothetical protein
VAVAKCSLLRAIFGTVTARRPEEEEEEEEEERLF